MPIIFLRDKGVNLTTLEPEREVVDGQQRIRTVIAYIQSKLLPELNPDRDEFTVLKIHNAELAGKKFEDLDTELRRLILDYTFSVHILPSSTDDREVLQLFARMNSTGQKLNPQELRNAAYYGNFKTVAYSTAFGQLFRWRNWRVFTEDNIARMEEVEMMSELILFTLKGVIGKNQAGLDNAYRDYDNELPHRKEIVTRIEAVFDEIEDTLGEEMKNSPFRKRAWFYALFGAMYIYKFESAAISERAKPRSLTKAQVIKLKGVAHDITEKKLPSFVAEAAARRTTHPSSRKALVEFLGTAFDAR